MTTAPRSLSDRALELARLTLVRRVITAGAVVASALLQAFLIQAFVNPANLLPSGFTGIAVLIDRITALFGVRISTDLGMLALNIPLAFICWNRISKRFVFFSMMQVALSAAFLRIFDFQPLLDDQIMLVVFGGFISGLSIAIALKAGASTGGTDFISLLVANRTGKTIWGFIFASNCALLVVFGALFGWEHAAYSIVFQFIATKTIDSFYHRYDRVTLQITTEHGDAVLKAYSRIFHHGSTRFKAQGGYSGKPVDFIVTVVSAYEADDIVRFVRRIDPHAVINVCKTENFVGNFHRAPADEPLPLEAEDTPQNDPVLEFIDTVRSNVEREASRPRRRYFNG